jgi:hypothetical protein
VSDPITLGIREVVELVVGLGGPLTIYVAMRERLVRLETKFETTIGTLVETVKAQGTARESHAEDIGDMRTDAGQARSEHDALRARVDKLEAKLSGNMRAVSVDDTGPQQPPPRHGPGQLGRRDR